MGNIKELNEEMKDILNKDFLIGNGTMVFPLLQQTHLDLIPYETLWNLAVEYETKCKGWEKSNIFKLDPEEIEKEIKTMIGQSRVLQNMFKKMDPPPDKPMKDAKELDEKLIEFNKHVPLLNYLCNEGLQDRHWSDINKVIAEFGYDLPINRDTNINLQTITQVGLMEILPQLEEVSDRASKEYTNQKLLDKMEGEWQTIELGLKAWKETGTFTIKGDSVEEIQTLLDEHIVKTQTMKGSPYAKVFEERITNWEEGLIYIQDSLDVWLKVQFLWIYLEPIFTSDDIAKSLPNENTKFKEIDRGWGFIMKRTLESPKALQIPKDKNLLKLLQNMEEQLDKIQRNLNNYLDKKRGEFPRFYFLSADSLIEIVSEAKEPTRVQKFMKNLFEGVMKLLFSEQKEIIGMESSEGEQCLLTEVVDTVTHKGLVEKWLRVFEDQMQFDIRALIEKATHEYFDMKREEFVIDRAGQVVINIDMTIWTSETEDAFTHGLDGLRDLKDELEDAKENIVRLIKTPITPLNRCTLEALIVLDVHNITVIEDLLDNKVENVTDFNYEAQMRYYWQKPSNGVDNKDQSIIKIINSTLDYNYEYLGNSSRLVITPLTDRCYRTLCSALYLNYGGAPEGPAGTGKTESVKDLAKALARMIIVFNCSDNLDFKSMGRFFKGLCSTGGWSCFDEFNRIS
jgi:dynein heavy chain